MPRHLFMCPRLEAAAMVTRWDFRHSPWVVRSSWLRGAKMSYSQINIFLGNWVTFATWRNCHHSWAVRLTFWVYWSWGRHTSFPFSLAHRISRWMLQLGF